MKRCESCGAENRSAAKFCTSCGVALAAGCPRCGHPNLPTSRFCMECGGPLAEARADVRPAVPPHLAEKILASRAGLEGERKQVTVLFADISGSTELIQGLDAEEAQALLDGAVKVMMDAVHRYEGTVSRAMGDGIMALFGAPIAHEDHAVRASYASLAIQEAMRRYAEQVRRLHGVVVETRVGLNSGEVIVRLISDDLHMDYTAMGQTVHLAARLEQMASSGTTLLSSETLRLAEGYVQVRSLGPVSIRGLADPVEAFELLGAGLARTRLQASAARGLARFVGRRAELEALHGALERAKAGHGQLAALVGEPGVGKSRLVWEVTHSHRTQGSSHDPAARGWTILESASVPYGRATAYLPIIDLLKRYCGIEPQDDTRAVREKVSGKLLTLDRALEPALPALLSLLDVDNGDPAWERLDPCQRRRRTLDALKRLLLRESQEQPLLLVFEDLHWIDGESQALLDALVDSLPTTPILLLVTYRPEYAHTWTNRSYYTHLRIDPLPPESADELLGAILGKGAELEPLKRALIERTEGNPLFLEESIRSLVESGALVGEPGAYCLAQPIETLRMPATVQAVLAARIDRLPAADKRLLQSAAAIGTDVAFALLAAIAELPDDDLQRGLARLQAAELLYEASLFPEPAYTFRHALTHEVTYGSLLQERRRELHGRVVEAIERLYPDRLDEHLERLADHAARGQAWERAFVYARQAGVRAAARSVYRDAVAQFAQALAALRHLPQTREVVERAIDLQFSLRSAFVGLGDGARALDCVRQAESLATTIGDRRRLGWVAGYMCNYLSIEGDAVQAVEAGTRALALASEHGDFALQVLARFFLGRLHLWLGDFPRAIELLGANVAAIGEGRAGESFGLPGSAAVQCLDHLVDALAEVGEFDAALTRADEMASIAQALDQPFSLFHADFGLAFTLLYRGDLPGAIRSLERALPMAEGGVGASWLRMIAALLGLAYALAGQTDLALEMLGRAGEPGDEARGKIDRALTFPLWGELCLLVGRIERAADWAAQALDATRRCQARGREAWTLRLLGEIAAHRGPPDRAEAEARYREALAIAEVLGMRPLQAHCHLGLGKLYRRMGREDEARAELAGAVELLRAMEMAFWLPEAEAELAEAAR